MTKSLKKEAIKSSGAIFVTGSTNLRQRQLNNILLANAFDNLKTQNKHKINLTTINRYLSDSYNQNDSNLKSNLKALADVKVEWNLTCKDGSPNWGYSSMIAGVEIKNGECIYGYSPLIIEKLSDPKFYVKINLKLQNKFNSKYSLILYEICLDSFISKRAYGYTPWFPLALYRKLMGIGEGEYPLFKDLKKWVITPSVKEVNEYSDLELEVEFKREGRKIVELRFCIKPNKNKKDDTALEALERFEQMQGEKQPDSLEMEQDPSTKAFHTKYEKFGASKYDQLGGTKSDKNKVKYEESIPKSEPPKEPAQEQEQSKSAQKSEESDTIPVTLKEGLQKIEVKEAQWQSLINRYGLERVQMGVEMTLLATAGGTIKNPVGWFMNTLKSEDFDFALVEKGREQREKEEREAEEKRQREEQERLRREQEEREKAEKAKQAEEKANRIKAYIADNPAESDRIILNWIENILPANKIIYSTLIKGSKAQGITPLEFCKANPMYKTLSENAIIEHLESNPPKPVTTIQESTPPVEPVVEIRENPKTEKRTEEIKTEQEPAQNTVPKPINHQSEPTQTQQAQETTQNQSKEESEQQSYDNLESVRSRAIETPIQEDLQNNSNPNFTLSENPFENQPKQTQTKSVQKVREQNSQTVSDLFSQSIENTEPVKSHPPLENQNAPRNDFKTPRSDERQKVDQSPVRDNQPKQIGSLLGAFKKWFR